MGVALAVLNETATHRSQSDGGHHTETSPQGKPLILPTHTRAECVIVRGERNG